MNKIKDDSKFNRFFRIFGIVGASLVIASSVALSAFLIMDVAEINYFLMDSPRKYVAQFSSEGKVFKEFYIERGQEVKVPTDNPTHSYQEYYEYTFEGWDTNGDGVVDNNFPKRMYYSFRADAVYSYTYNPPPEPEDPDNPNPPEEDPGDGGGIFR